MSHHSEWSEAGGNDTKPVGIGTLACGNHTFMATLLFDPSMSVLPVIETQMSQGVGLITRQWGT